MKRSFPFCVIVVLFGISLVSLLVGQTVAVFNYDFAVRLGMQPHVDVVGESIVAVGRGFGVGDTLVFAPLTAASLVGLLLRKRWALWTTGATLAVTAYVGSTCTWMLIFLRGVPGFHWQPGIAMWIMLGGNLVFAVWGFFYVMFRGDRLLA